MLQKKKVLRIYVVEMKFVLIYKFCSTVDCCLVTNVKLLAAKVLAGGVAPLGTISAVILISKGGQVLAFRPLASAIRRKLSLVSMLLWSPTP